MEIKNRLVVANAGWGESLPEWLLKEIENERFFSSLAQTTAKGKLTYKELVGDAEVVAYLMTASLVAPMSRDYTEIYLYISARLMTKKGMMTEEQALETAGEIWKRGLDEYQRGLLNDLKYQLYRKRGGDIQHPLISLLKELQK